MQQFFSDGTVSLQTRSARYGKLSQGCFVRVYSALVKRCKKHFHSFPFGITVILGNNGYIWISVTSEEEHQANKEKVPFMPRAAVEAQREITFKDRENMVRVRNCILALQQEFLPIYPETIMDVYESSLQIAPKNILLQDVVKLITTSAAERIKKIAEEQILAAKN